MKNCSWRIIVVLFVLWNGQLKSQDNLSQKVFSHDEYHCLGIEASTNSNLVLIHFLEYSKLEEFYKFYEEGIDTTGWVYIIAYNLDSNRVVFKNKHYEYYEGDVEEKGGSLVFDYRDYYWDNRYLLSGDTIFSAWKGYHIGTGEVVWTRKSIRLWREGGSLHNDTCISSTVTKDYNVKVDPGSRNVSFSGHNIKHDKENDQIVTYAKVKNFFNVSQKTNLLNDKFLINEYLSFEISQGGYTFMPLTKSLFFHSGGSWSIQNIRLSGSESLIDEVAIKKHRIRLVTLLMNFGFTKSFGELNRYFCTIQGQGGINAYARYTYWDEFDEKHKRKKSVLNRFDYGTKVIIGKSRWGLSAEYRLSRLFKKDIQAYDAAPFSVGIEFQSWNNGRAGPSRSKWIRLK
jgi:hypothetical protein